MASISISLFILFSLVNTDLPDEVLLSIFQYLMIQTLLKGISHVCRRFNEIVQENSVLWRDIDLDVYQTLLENHLANIMQYASHFDLFSVSCLLPTPLIDEHLQHFETSKNLVWLDLSYSTLSNLKFLKI